jgi:hypothetical protein
MIKQLRYVAAGLAVGLAGISGTASATPCSSVLSSFSSCMGSASCEAQYISEHPECFGGSSTTSAIQIGSTTFAQAGAITQALMSRLRDSGPGPRASLDGTTGLAAGNATGWNLWANYSNNASRVRYTNTLNTQTHTDSNVETTLLGGDFALSPKTALGVSVGLDRGNGSGGTVGGQPNSTGSNGYVIAPYIGYQISKELALDASAGWGEGEFSSGAIKSDADRWFAGANLSYSQWMNNVQVTGKLSYLHGEEKYGDSKNAGAAVAGTASKNTVDQARLGVQAGYWMNGFMPYAGLVYASDFHRSVSKGAAVDPLGRSAFVLSLGVNFFSLASKMTGGIAYEQESGRTNSKNEKLMANINFRF